MDLLTTRPAATTWKQRQQLAARAKGRKVSSLTTVTTAVVAAADGPIGQSAGSVGFGEGGNDCGPRVLGIEATGGVVEGSRRGHEVDNLMFEEGKEEGTSSSDMGGAGASCSHESSPNSSSQGEVLLHSSGHAAEMAAEATAAVVVEGGASCDFVAVKNVRQWYKTKGDGSHELSVPTSSLAVQGSTATGTDLPLTRSNLDSKPAADMGGSGGAARLQGRGRWQRGGQRGRESAGRNAFSWSPQERAALRLMQSVSASPRLPGETATMVRPVRVMSNSSSSSARTATSSASEREESSLFSATRGGAHAKQYQQQQHQRQQQQQQQQPRVEGKAAGREEVGAATSAENVPARWRQ